MKALIICDDDDVIKKTKETLASSGYDSIVYRWLLKALDNVEEIDPDMVVISSCDYPRHWKTFVSYLQTYYIGKNESPPKVIIFSPDNLTGEEQKKANALGIAGFYSNVRFDGIASLKSLVSEKKEFVTVTATEKQTVSADRPNQQKCTMMFTHPVKKTFITGSIINISDDEKTIEFSPDILQSVRGIFVGDKITELSLKTPKGIKMCRADVTKISAEQLTFKIA